MKRHKRLFQFLVLLLVLMAVLGVAYWQCFMT